MKDGVWIYGIGASGKLMYRYLNENNREICGIIDNSPLYAKGGVKYEDVPIYPYAKAKTLLEKDDYIIICTPKEWFDKITKELSNDGYKNTAWIYECIDFDNYTNRLLPKGYDARLISKVCDSEDFKNPEFTEIREKVKICQPEDTMHIVFHRKVWEWCYIALLLKNMDMLQPGKSGLGFAVGKEPLPALFASNEVKVLSTDLDCNNDMAKPWANSNQNAGSNVDNLYYPSICEKTKFYNNVRYADVDMNSIPDELCREQFDFCWSSCAIEHVGSLRQSKEFILNMVKCLKPGGVAIHTTEFNLSSKKNTIEQGTNVLWRKKDIDEIIALLNEAGCDMDITYARSDTDANNYIDMPPYKGEGKPYHMNLGIDGYASTSIAMVIKKR